MTSDAGHAQAIADAIRGDRTSLTTAALLHEVSQLKELIETRLNAMDKAMSLMDELPSSIVAKSSSSLVICLSVSAMC